MKDLNLFEIKKYNFNQEEISKIEEDQYVKGLWPLVYVLSHGNLKEAYVGETTDAKSRMISHLKNKFKSKLDSVRIITSDKFNKSATLDIESNLIKYLSADGQFKLLNGNIGLANHTYYQKKEIYWDMFKTIWNELKSEGLTKKTLEQIDNSDLFKYSPYKTLDNKQKLSLIYMFKGLLSNDTKCIIAEGGAGTGKTILAIFLFKLLHSEVEDLDPKNFGEDEKEFIKLVLDLKIKFPNPKMALVIPMRSFRNTIKKVFQNIKGLNASMVIGPAEVVNSKFDILVVDESHRLRQRSNLGAYFGAFDKVNKKLDLDKNSGNELDWIIKQSEKSLLFYDENQSIKPSDVSKENFYKLKENKNTTSITLTSQFRVRGGNDYVTYIDNLLNCKFRRSDNKFSSEEYEFKLFNSIEEMISQIRIKDSEFGLSRLVAGYSWKWVSRNSDIHDIEIDNVKLRWNSVKDDFINSENAINEVGCIHTTQGYDLNYTGVIFGKEISYDPILGRIFINKENYYDMNGRNGITNPDVLHSYIINIYKTLMLRGIKGTYVYVCDENLKKYFEKYISLNKGIKEEQHYSINAKSPYSEEFISIPLFNSVGCGELMFADPTIQDMVKVKKDLISEGSKYFILRTSGDSMNKAGINDGDLVLCQKNYYPSEGSVVVALIGDDATIKEYHRKDGAIILKPNSDNKFHKTLQFKDGDDIRIQGVVVRVLEKED